MSKILMIATIAIFAVAVSAYAQDQQTVSISASVVEYVTVAEEDNDFCLSGKNAALYHVFSLEKGNLAVDDRRFKGLTKTQENCHRLIEAQISHRPGPQWIMISPE